MSKNIPVYLFVGFLESGKTTFIKKKLLDKEFMANDFVLLLVCEDGFEEYDEYPNVKIEKVYESKEVNKSYFDSINGNYDKIMIEANGMEKTDKLISSFPDNWMLYQQLMFIDSKTFKNYNMMFRELMVDKINGSELIVFNRINEKSDKKFFHKSIRMISKLKDIYYEDINEIINKDEEQDPLPYDIASDTIDLNFKDYAYFYQNLNEETIKYFGKKLKFKAQARYLDKILYIGRKVMICCEADIKYLGLYVINNEEFPFKEAKWYDVIGLLIPSQNEGSINGIGIKIMSVSLSENPDINEEVATFY